MNFTDSNYGKFSQFFLSITKLENEKLNGKFGGGVLFIENQGAQMKRHNFSTFYN